MKATITKRDGCVVEQDCQDVSELIRFFEQHKDYAGAVIEPDFSVESAAMEAAERRIVNECLRD